MEEIPCIVIFKMEHIGLTQSRASQKNQIFDLQHQTGFADGLKSCLHCKLQISYSIFPATAQLQD